MMMMMALMEMTMMIAKLISTIIITISLISLVNLGCSHSAESNYSNIIEKSLICPGAKEIKWNRAVDFVTVSYKVDENYVPSNTLGYLKTTLQKSGYNVHKGVGTYNGKVIKSEWSKFYDSTIIEEGTVPVLQYLMGWTKGDKLVLIVLRYMGEVNGDIEKIEGLTSLRVNILFREKNNKDIELLGPKLSQ